MPLLPSLSSKKKPEEEVNTTNEYAPNPNNYKYVNPYLSNKNT